MQALNTAPPPPPCMQVSASSHCQAMIEAPQHRHFFISDAWFLENLEPLGSQAASAKSAALTYANCVYARSAGTEQSTPLSPRTVSHNLAQSRTMSEAACAHHGAVACLQVRSRACSIWSSCKWPSCCSLLR